MEVLLSPVVLDEDDVPDLDHVCYIRIHQMSCRSIPCQSIKSFHIIIITIIIVNIIIIIIISLLTYSVVVNLRARSTGSSGTHLPIGVAW